MTPPHAETPLVLAKAALWIDSRSNVIEVLNDYFILSQRQMLRTLPHMRSYFAQRATPKSLRVAAPQTPGDDPALAYGRGKRVAMYLFLIASP